MIRTDFNLPPNCRDTKFGLVAEDDVGVDHYIRKSAGGYWAWEARRDNESAYSLGGKTLSELCAKIASS